MKTITSLVTVLALTLALTSTAFAQGASSDPYVDEGGQVQGQIGDEGTGGTGGTGEAAANTTSGDTGGSLPFTGLDLSLIAGGGVLLLAAGIAMRRLTPGSRSA
jgi:hypothetical protein